MPTNINIKVLKSKLNDLSYKLQVIESLARVLDNCSAGEVANLESYDCECLTSVLYENIKELNTDFGAVEQLL